MSQCTAQRTNAAPRYVIVSPVRDEERHVELTLRSVVQQEIKPLQWIIVDDGSRDATRVIVRRYAEAHPFIRLVDSATAGPRQPGSGVINAFNRGYQAVDVDHEFLVKLDCDLSFGPAYFEQIFARFRADDRLGIGSGVYLEEKRAGGWHLIEMSAYHAFGGCKVLRRACFDEIRGFVPRRGWDTADEIRAWSKGWATRHFRDLTVRHHKPEGSGIGLVRTSVMHGEIYYTTGGDPLFFVFKCLHRLRLRPFLVGPIALVFGYVRAWATRQERLVTPEEARKYRKLLRRRLWSRASDIPVALSPARSGR